MPVFIEIWCNGSTADFGSASSGSSPDISTNGLTLIRQCSKQRPFKDSGVTATTSGTYLLASRCSLEVTGSNPVCLSK